MNLRIFDSTADLIRATARVIEQRAADGSSIALSGGSTPQPLYELLGSPPHRGVLAEKGIIWVVVDERYVPLYDPQSNAAMIQRTLFREGVPPKHHFLRFNTELAEPVETARVFEDHWRALGLRELDLILLGIGEDGHTASLFPETPVLAIQDRIAAEVFVPRLNQWRVTLTMPVIRAAKLRIVMVAGASKAKVLREIQEGKEYPITRATAGDIETWWLVDRAAADSPVQSTLT